MDNSLVVREVALRADDAVLELLSRIPTLWSIVRQELHQQFFWYQRTLEAFNLPEYLSWSNTSNENWHQIYNILVATRAGNPFRNSTVLDLNEWNLIAVKLLLEWNYRPTTHSMHGAAEYGSLDLLDLILGGKQSSPRMFWIDSDVLSELLSGATSGARVDVLEFLLKDKRTQDVLDDGAYTVLLTAFEEAVYASHVAAADLIMDEIVSRDITIYEFGDAQDNLLEEAIEHSSPEMIQYLIDQDLVDVGNSHWIQVSIDRRRPQVFFLLLGDESPFKYLSSLAADEIDKYIPDRTRGPIRSAAQLSELSEASILSMLTANTEDQFNKYHFELLLRQIVQVQADLDYYVSWLTETTKSNIRFYKSKEETRATSRLFLSCIDSISTSQVVHTSDYFTAYSAFFLLANSPTRDVQSVLNTVESEAGVTEEGLLKARVLLGAFDGRDRARIAQDKSVAICLRR